MCCGQRRVRGHEAVVQVVESAALRAQPRPEPAREADVSPRRPDALSLDDLPRYSEWPARLLGLEAYPVRYKGETDVRREYEVDKWGTLLRQVRALDAPTVLDVEAVFVDLDAELPCYEDGTLFMGTERTMLDKHLGLYEATLRPYLDNASALVELGAGYGSKLLGLCGREGFADLPLYAGEYTSTGRELIELVSRSSLREIKVGHCDFRNMRIEGLHVPENAVIFTSYATHYVPMLAAGFIDFLAALKPRAVIHFEPCYEHFDGPTLHGLMCRRYVELNDYNRNLASLVEEHRAAGRISTRVQRNVLGSNPFLPLSIIEWTAQQLPIG